MGMLKAAFTTVCRLHSRSGYLKRPGTPDIYSAIRITPSQYYRNTVGPSQISYTGKEVIVPVAAIIGQLQQSFTPDVAPTAGTFTLSFKINGVDSLLTTSALDFDSDATDIQSALRLLTGLENVTVTGSLLTVLIISFIGVKSVDVSSIDISLLTTTADVAINASSVPWDSPLFKRGDKIIDATGTNTIKEIEELVDLGGEVMGCRLRMD